MYFDVTTKSFKEENREAAKIAFAASDKELSWEELKNLSVKIGEALRKINIPKYCPVLVYGDKEAFFLAAILACYQAGLPFVPVNNSLPENRIRKIIEQTQSRVLIACGDEKNIPEMSAVIKNDLSIHQKETIRFCEVKDAAYILFTSGSSGEPKGVIISDENIRAFTQWFIKEFPVHKETVFINRASFLFDISLADFFGTLQTGGTCIFNTNDMAADTCLFFERIHTYKGNYWNSTPSFISKCFSDKNFNAQNLPGIRHFVLAGENLSTSLVRELKSRFPQAIIINAYGPTETTIYASYTEITEELLSENTLPICKAENEVVFLVNEEIIIAGNVGIGYLNNIELTQQRFLVHPKKAFRTGDMAFIKNGYVYYSGRKDEQIKFNGYRIELNEIKRVLEKMAFIEQAECLPIIIEGNIKRLIAFVKTMEEINISEVKKSLEKELPAYMIPSEIILRKEFPYTNSDKPDKQKLLSDYLGN